MASLKVSTSTGVVGTRLGRVPKRDQSPHWMINSSSTIRHHNHTRGLARVWTTRSTAETRWYCGNRVLVHIDDRLLCYQGPTRIVGVGGSEGQGRRRQHQGTYGQSSQDFRRGLYLCYYRLHFNSICSLILITSW